MKKIITLLLALVISTAFVMSVSAGNFVSSIGEKPEPQPIDIKGKDGQPHIAIITDKEGNEIYIDPDSLTELIFTSIAEADNAPGGSGQSMKDIYNQILKATKITEVFPALAGKLGTVNEKNLVVIDLFNVRLVEDGKVIDFPEGSTLTFSVLTPCKDGDFFIPLYQKDGSWVIPEFTINNDGIATIKTDVLSEFVFIAESDEPGDDGPDSPATGDKADALIAGSVALIAAAAWVSKKH